PAPGPRRRPPPGRRPGISADWIRPHPRAGRRPATRPGPGPRPRTSARLAVRLGGRVELELAPHPRERVVDMLAEHDAAAVEFDLEHAALGQAQGVAHGLGQGDLAPLGHGGFHRLAPWMKRYGNMIHTLSSILQPAYFGPTPPPAA